MTQSFEIRFARSAGLFGLLEAPANSFRWKGGGTLTVDQHGITVSAASWFPLLRPQRLRFTPAELQRAYREGESVRLEFSESHGPLVLPVWAKNAETAAEMVRALPTNRTVELEQSPDIARARVRYDRRVLASVCAAGALLIFGVLAALPQNKPEPLDTAAEAEFIPDPSVLEASTPESAVPLAEIVSGPPADSEPRSEVQTTLADSTRPEAASSVAPPPGAHPEGPASPAANYASSTNAPDGSAPAAFDAKDAEPFVPEVPEIIANAGQLVVPIREGTAAYNTARSILAWFEKAATSYNEQLGKHLAEAEAGRIRQQDLIRDLATLEMRWRGLTSGLLATAEAKLPELTGFRSTLISVVIYQASFLDGYAAGLRSGDQDALARAYAERERADQALERARQYLR